MDDVRVFRFAPMSGIADERGHRLLARFDCRARGVKFYGFGLWLRSPGYFSLGQTRARREGGEFVGATVIDRDLERAILTAAHAYGSARVMRLPPLALPNVLARLPADDRTNEGDDAGLRQFLRR